MLVACLAFLSLIAVLPPSEGASTVLIEDDFTGDDGDIPNADLWKVLKQDLNDIVEISDNSLLTNTVNMGHTRVEYIDYVTVNEFTIEVDYMVTYQSGRCFDVIINTFMVDRLKGMVSFCYDPGYGWHVYYRVDGNYTLHVSRQRTLRNNVWYTFNVTIGDRVLDIVVTDRDSGDVRWSFTDVRMDRLLSENYFRFGCFGANPDHSPRCFWDNFRLVAEGDITPKPPVWGELPVFRAVEDEPLTINFTGNVSDPDTPLRRLRISSDSPYVTKVDNRTVTFLFPEGVTSADVILVLTDGRFAVRKTVQFIVEPVADPPECTMPSEHAALEDIPAILDFEPYLHDPDTPLSELVLTESSPYAELDGFVLRVLYPEGVLEDNITVKVTDGTFTIKVPIHFRVTPVDDPPVVDELGTFEAVEDRPSVMDIGPFLHDVDTPLEQLVVRVDDDNCTVEGHKLTFLYTTGGHEDIILVRVSDAQSTTVAVLRVRVLPMNDPPVVGEVPLQRFQEGQGKTLDLSPFVTDEDNPPSQLSVECDHPAVVGCDGLKLTMLYAIWEPDHIVEFQVFDTITKVPGSFRATVHDINLPPEILGIGEHDPPVVITVQAMTEHWLQVRVRDEDSSEFEYSLATDWDGHEVLGNGTLHLTPTDAHVGEHTGTVTVDDLNGGTDSLTFTVVVVPRNRPPAVPVIKSPEDGSSYLEGTAIPFDVEATDPDIPLGDELTVRWESDLDGTLRTMDLGPDMAFTLSVLSVGEHRITVTVSDGEFERSASIDLTVLEEPPPEPVPPEEPDFLASETGLLLLIIVILVIVIAVLLNKRRREGEVP